MLVRSCTVGLGAVGIQQRSEFAAKLRAVVDIAVNLADKIDAFLTMHVLYSSIS